MNILCISRDLSGADLFWRLKKEGHAVRFFVEDKNQRQCLAGMVERIDDWKKELKWVGKNGLIIFDGLGFGKTQDELRKDGYSVVGGSQAGEKLEASRQYGQKILSLCDVEILPSMSFLGAKEAAKFVGKNKSQWVIKQNGHVHSGFNYVGQMEDGSDVINVLKNYNRNSKEECSHIDIQKKVEGVEIGVGRYFNGQDWVGPIEVNFEHKNLLDGDLGPKTWEMGTLMWYDDNENNKLFQKTLAKLKPFLQKANFHGDFEISFMINRDKAYPLEITPRFGWPATHLQGEIHRSPWGEFLKAVADEKNYNLKWKKGFGVVVLVAVPPFPYTVKSKFYNAQGIDILFKKKMTEEEMNHIHFEEVALHGSKKNRRFYSATKSGFLLHVSGMGKTVEEAREKVHKLISNIVVPKMFYRTDIGQKFINEDKKKLKDWGWI